MLWDSLLSPAALVVLVSATGALARPAGGTEPRADTPCTEPVVRKEWRAMSSAQQQSYIDAVKCMQSTSGKTAEIYSGVKSLYDDFQALHISQTDNIHWVVAYHWTLDADTNAKFLGSPIFDTVHGFGGNGGYVRDTGSSNGLTASSKLSHITMASDDPSATGGGCVADGPFADHQVSMGPGNSTAYNPHCLVRDINPSFVRQMLGKAESAQVLSQSDFWHFTRRIEGATIGNSCHSAGHGGVGGRAGEMSNPYSSPGDPIFYLHHGVLDKLWNEWQRKVATSANACRRKLDWDARKADIGGPDTQFAYPYNYFGASPAYKNVTLEFEMNLGQIGGMKKISQAMDTMGGEFCYTYE
ncbi:N-acetyl-6-hydroxytryptophan oxidase ivoB [Apiospora hydei]|uniref:N-acetyl-6-hydroxytryptophan oxidase ivoB n=1 Tax=Apiospora hydei TaxID=1337664 RepID=A0ABR1WYQ1_9PEZI